MTLGTDYILNALAEEGLGHLFMVPGGLVDPFLPALARQDKLKPVVAAHEGGAAYMADGYARASGGFGAAIGIGGPGACNMATAVAAAKTDGSPVLVMTGEVPVDMEGRGAFQDASQATLDDTAVMAPLTRLSKTVADARNLNHDALTGECPADYVKVGGFFTGPQPLSLGDAERALALLADPKGGARIAILAGAGVEHDAAAARLKEVAERWSLPVATTLRAKGVFPEDHDLSLGVFGYAGTHSQLSLLARNDGRSGSVVRLLDFSISPRPRHSYSANFEHEGTYIESGKEQRIITNIKGASADLCQFIIKTGFEAVRAEPKGLKVLTASNLREVLKDMSCTISGSQTSFYRQEQYFRTKFSCESFIKACGFEEG